MFDNLTPEQKAKADQMYKYLVDKQSNEVDPSTRPGFSFSASTDLQAADEWLDKVRKNLGGWAPVYSAPENKNFSPQDLESHREQYVKGLKAIKASDLPKCDPSDFSMARLLFASKMANGNLGLGLAAMKKYAPNETKWLEAVTKAQGDMATGQAGGFLAPEIWLTGFLDILYAAQAIRRLPIRFAPAAGRIEHMPKLVSPATVSYSAENSALLPSMGQFAQTSWTQRKQYVFMEISNELIMDSNPEAEQIFRAHMATQLGLDQDYQVLMGNGQAGAPVGVYNSPGVTKGQTAGASLAYTDLTTGIYNVTDLNGATNVPVGQALCTGIVGVPKLIPLLENMVDSSGRPLLDFGFGLQRSGFRRGPDNLDRSTLLDGLFGVPTWGISNVYKNTVSSSGSGYVSVPSLALQPVGAIIAGPAGANSPIFFGDWQHLWVRERMDVEFVASNVAGTSFQNDQTWIRAIRRYDSQCVHPEVFYVINNVAA